MPLRPGSSPGTGRSPGPDGPGGNPGVFGVGPWGVTWGVEGPAGGSPGVPGPPGELMNCCAEWTTCAEAAPGSKTIAAAVPAAMKAGGRCLLGVRDVMFRCSSSFEISPREGGTAAPSGAVDPSFLAIDAPN